MLMTRSYLLTIMKEDVDHGTVHLLKEYDIYKRGYHCCIDNIKKLFFLIEK